MDLDKLNMAADDCLRDATAAPLPFSSVHDCIEKLKADPDWTDAEIIEVQTRVIRQLMQQLGRGG
jgi:hypothetical protein